DTRNVGPSRSPFLATLDRGSSSPGSMGSHPNDLRIPTNELGIENQSNEIGISHLGQVSEERPRDRGVAAGQRSIGDARNEIYELTISCSHIPVLRHLSARTVPGQPIDPLSLINPPINLPPHVAYHPQVDPGADRLLLV